ncbi:MAG: bifunctional phosphopantothenoylcysteine decarboxylase/phosphopantothenate--cysteine ligase CoaBC [Candidatus Glassbacteria bacterium]|nr:bifunctional phosphopantothenoylcysteine decarboxylase/phosphopantothenate--cysteine ligase CoaBC [Candidatus Glassbacteria bacterium]
MEHLIGGKRIVLGLTGGIACYKVCDLASHLVQLGARVRVVMTENATRFVGPVTLRALTGEPVYTDTFGNEEPGGIDHLRLAEFAELLVVAPATADILARMAHGLADDLLSTTLLSCPAPVLVAPAMESRMWNHPATRANLELLAERGVHVLPPETGRLASGATGAGRLPGREVLVEAIAGVLGAGDLLAGKTVLVTAGPTREMLDPVRFISNPSSGRMGFALARAARRQGAKRVQLVTGPVALTTPLGVERHDVTGAEQMLEAVESVAAQADLIFAAAAVGDFTPAQAQQQKIKKEDAGELILKLERTPDVLAWLSANRKKGAVVVGFAVETEREEEHALAKLEKKALDLVVLNNPSHAGAGFAGDTNKAVALGPGGLRQEYALMSKDELADKLIELAVIQTKEKN